LLHLSYPEEVKAKSCPYYGIVKGYLKIHIFSTKAEERMEMHRALC
jgi:hypothetical protein